MIDLKELKARINWRDIYSDVQNQKNDTESWIKGCCPLHHDKTPSFGFNKDTLAWVCFAGCGKGDVFSFISANGGGTFKEIVYDLAHKTGLPITNSCPPINEKLIDRWHTALLRNTPILEGLKAKRGLFNGSITKYKIGYDPIRRRLTIPIRNQQGEIMNVRLYNSKASNKIINYTNSQHKYGSPARLYGVDELINYTASDPVIICEGEWDRLVLQEAGFTAVTGTCGCGSFLTEWTPYFAGKHVVIMYDCDTEGQAAAENVVVKAFQNTKVKSLKNVRLPLSGEKTEKDITDYLASFNGKIELFSREIKRLISDTLPIDLTVPVVQTNNPPSFCYWFEKIEKITELKIDILSFMDYLKSKGYCWLSLKLGEFKLPLIQIINNIVREVDIATIRRDVFADIEMLPNKISNNFSRENLKNVMLRGIDSVYISPAKLDYLPKVEIKLCRDTKDMSYDFFLNGFVETTRQGRMFRPYSELHLPIWQSQQIQRNIMLRVDISSVSSFPFVRFVSNACTHRNTDNPAQSVREDNRFEAIQTTIGYLQHNYNDETYQKAVVFCDSSLDQQANGRTGKGLICRAIGYMKKITTINGKSLDFSKQFVLGVADMGRDTQVVRFDDVKKNFDFRELFSHVTEGMSYQKKGKDEVNFSIADSPKIVITTNYAIKGEGDSHRGRIFEIELLNYYNAEYTPETELNCRFFSWTTDEWNIFDNFMLICKQEYFMNNARMLPYTSDTLEKKKLICMVGEGFVDYMESILLPLLLSGEVLQFQAFQDFKETLSETQQKNYSTNRFGTDLKRYLDHVGYELLKIKRRDGDQTVRTYGVKKRHD